MTLSEDSKMVYAPIIIPTCNRFYHFKRCVESLKNNAWAPFTEIYISLDYPPGEKYVQGHDEIKQYLNEGLHGFKEVYIFYQESNLGAYDNERFLISTVYKKYDRYIFTEDDNVFSPNFIEFIDKGLVIFEHDDNILAICATRASDKYREKDCGNIVKSKKFAGYGFGIWRDRERQYEEKISRRYMLKIASSPVKVWKLYQENSKLLLAFAAALLRKQKVYILEDGEIAYVDDMIKVYMLMENKYVIHPLEIISINLGYDGSGLNCPVVNKNLSEKMLTQETSFEYDIREVINERTYSKVDRKMNFIRSVHAAVSVMLYALFKRE